MPQSSEKVQISQSFIVVGGACPVWHQWCSCMIKETQSGTDMSVFLVRFYGWHGHKNRVSDQTLNIMHTDKHK